MAFIFCIVLLIALLVLRSRYKELEKVVHKHEETIQLLMNKMSQLGFSDDILRPEETPKVQQIEQQTVIMNQVYPQNVNHQEKLSKPKKEKGNFENVFGKNVLGFIAAILVFIGMIAFGALVLSYVTDIIKVIAMFLFSIGITVLGTYLHKKKNSPFTASVTGCGVGAIFVSIFVAHLYFGVITDIVAFGMVLIWAIFVFVLAKHLQSNILLYIAHIGCLVSILLASGYGKLEDKLIEITVYQILVIVLLLIMDVKTSTKLFKVTAFGSFVVNALLSIQCLNLIQLNAYDNAAMSVPHLSENVLLIVIFALTILACVIHVISAKVYIKNPIAELIATNLLFLANIHVFAISISEVKTENQLLWINVFLTVIVVAVVAGFVLFVNRALATKITLLSCMTYLGIIYFATASDLCDEHFVLPGIFIFAMISTGLYLKTKDKLYFKFGVGYLITDAFLALFVVKPEFVLWYALILLASSFGIAYLYNRNMMSLGLASYTLLNISVMPSVFIFLDDIDRKVTDSDVLVVIGMLALTITNIVFKLVYDKISTNDTLAKVTKIIIKICLHLWIFANSICIAIELPAKDNMMLFMLLLLLAFASFFIGMMDITKMEGSNNHALGVWYGIKFTWLTIFPLTQFTSFLDEQFIFSLACMVVATICILFGFKFNVKSIRVYGLIVVLASVLKIVIIDVWGRESLIRVISLLLGGLICFAISAIYNKFEQKYKDEEMKEITEEKIGIL